MNIFIPLADGHSLHPDVMHGICMQTVKCFVIPITRSKVAMDYRISEAECRNELRQYASEPYSIMMDCTTVFTSETDVADAIAAMDARPDMDALAYNTKPKTAENLDAERKGRHIDIGCMIVRSEVLRRVTFRSLTPGGCLCPAFNQDVKIDWIDHQQLREVAHGR